MSTLHSPPKLRSYVDHRPHSASEMFRKWNPRAYVDHWPGLSDMRRPLLKRPNGYVDHYARPGDMVTMSTQEDWDAETQALSSGTDTGSSTLPPLGGSATLALDVTAAPDMSVSVIDATGWYSGDTAILQGNTYSVTSADTAARTIELHYVSGPTPDGTVIPVGTPITHG